MKTIVMTGGGTAGHITPNIALIPKLRNAGFNIHYIGLRGGMEESLIKQQGIEFHGINGGKLRRYFDIKNFTDLFRIGAGFFESVSLLGKIKPDIVFQKAVLYQPLSFGRRHSAIFRLSPMSRTSR